MEKLSFLKKLKYRFLKKDPTSFKVGTDSYEQMRETSPSGRVFSKRTELSDFEKAVMSGNLDDLGFFKKYSKISQSVLASALLLAPSVDVVRKLEDMGAKINKDDLPRVVRNVVSHRPYDYKKNLDFFSEKGVSMNFQISDRTSLYDVTKDKNDWFEKATPEEIKEEFKNAVKSGNVEKAKTIFEFPTDKVKIDINEKDKDGYDPMSYALSIEDPQMATEMATFLYDHKAKLHTEDSSSLNAFERARPEIQEALLKKCLNKGDLLGLFAADKAGIPLNKTDYIFESQNPDVLIFLAKRGANLNEARYELDMNTNETMWMSDYYKAQFNAIKMAQDDIADEKGFLKNMTPTRIKEIEHDFRQAVGHGDQEKAYDMMMGYEDVLDLVNSENSKGDTALMYAIQRNDIGMAKTLYQKGASLSHQNKEGKNPFHRVPTKAMYSMLLTEAIAKGDVDALKAADTAGIDVSSFKEMAKAKNPQAYNYFVERDKKLASVVATAKAIRE